MHKKAFKEVSDNIWKSVVLINISVYRKELCKPIQKENIYFQFCFILYIKKEDKNYATKYMQYRKIMQPMVNGSS